MLIRRLTAGDVDAVFAAASLFDRPLDPLAVRGFLADPDSYLLIAYEDGRPVGFVRAHEIPQLHTPRRQLFLYEIEVAAEARRRGLGRALIEELVNTGRRSDFDEMFVITNESNVPAMRLYASTGGNREAPDDVVFIYPFAAKSAANDDAPLGTGLA